MAKSIYVGYQKDGSKRVPAQPHVLVTGPTGVGKTFRVLGPAVYFWRGPVVAVSSKPDVLEMTGEARSARGPVYVLDLGGNVDVPSWATRVRVDPVRALTSEDEALDLASLLMRVGGVGASGSASLEGGTEANLWQSQAAAPLAAIMWAYRHEGMETVIRALGNADGTPDSGPGWLDVVKREPDSLLSASLVALAEQEPRQRSSVVITMNQGLAPWTRASVRGEKLAAFSPEMLDDNEATLYIVSPATGVAAGAAVAMLSGVVTRWRTATERGEPAPPVLFAIDEMANTAPLPDLPVWVTEARGMGVRIMGAVQTSDQLVMRWGEAAGTVLRRTFPQVLALRGSAEKDLFEDAVLWGGEVERVREMRDGTGDVSTTQAEMLPRYRVNELLPPSVEFGRLMSAGSVGHLVRLPTYHEILAAQAQRAR